MTPSRRLRLAFVSTVFLLPEDAGGKIRSCNVLRGLKGGIFEVTLISPASEGQAREYAAGLGRLADHFVAWAAATVRPRWTRVLDLFGALPASVKHGLTAHAHTVVNRTLAEGGFDVVVFDFVHATELMPQTLLATTVCFTHNVEAEIFTRHVEHATNPAMRWVWASQARKMARFERQALARYTSVIAVSVRDASQFSISCGRSDVQTIPTAVDLDFFSWQAPPPVDALHPPTVVFTGSMDWAANVDGVGFFLSEVWPLVLSQLPQARFVVVGRNPPNALLRQAQGLAGVKFTGFVEDVRPYVRAAHVFAIPLRVGGGTRIKAFEAMAIGCPVVSSALGVEGLDVVAAQHYLRRDSAADQAKAIVGLFDDEAERLRLSRQARQLVEQRFGHLAAAAIFEQICLSAHQSYRRPAATVALGQVKT